MRVDNVSDSSQIHAMQHASSPRRLDAPADRPRDFTPAMPVLGLYDLVVRLYVRDKVWRRALLARLSPRDGDVIVDAGCGTGTLLKAIGQGAPDARLIGIDPDERVLARAGDKLSRAGVTAELRRGYLRDLDRLLAGLNVGKVTSSLVFHQVPLVEKRAGLAAIFAALAPGGMLLIADYGQQRTAAMRALFKVVQYVDGFDDTQPNADGMMPGLMREAGFVEVEETDVFRTASGAISIYRGMKPATGSTAVVGQHAQ